LFIVFQRRYAKIVGRRNDYWYLDLYRRNKYIWHFIWSIWLWKRKGVVAMKELFWILLCFGFMLMLATTPKDK